MSRVFILCLASIFASSNLSAQQLQYRGTLEQVARNGQATHVKEFEIHCFLKAGRTSEVFYVIEESNTSLPWIEQFGEVDPRAEILSNSGIVIGYRHLGRNYVIPVGAPFFRDHKELQLDYEWQTADGEFVIAGEKTLHGEPCWEVKATIGIARHHVFYVRKASPIIEAGTQTVFMGPGDRFRLSYERIANNTPQPTDSGLAQTVQLLMDIRSDVERDRDSRFAPISPEHVKSFADALPNLAKVAKETKLEGFVSKLQTEVQTRMNRDSRVQNLAGTMVGKPAPKLTLQTLDSQEIHSDSFSGKTVVLHFWDYANPTLEQPYGQVGYLDFLNGRWLDKDVLIYGVAVNSQLIDPETKAKAIREIQKLKQFMKLGYEITFDNGSVLNGFGNPTRLGEELPLWIVISPDGKIVHYKTGYYEVDNRVGLREIHEIFEQSNNE